MAIGKQVALAALLLNPLSPQGLEASVQDDEGIEQSSMSEKEQKRVWRYIQKEATIWEKELLKLDEELAGKSGIEYDEQLAANVGFALGYLNTVGKLVNDPERVLAALDDNGSSSFLTQGRPKRNLCAGWNQIVEVGARRNGGDREAAAQELRESHTANATYMIINGYSGIAECQFE